MINICPISDTSESKRKKIGRLTPANLSRELSTDVSYPENIYSWLKKQNDQSFSPRSVMESQIKPFLAIFASGGGQGLSTLAFDLSIRDLSQKKTLSRQAKSALNLNFIGQN